MKENNNRFEQNDLSLNSKEIKKTKEDFVWRITETLKNKETAKTSNNLAELKDSIHEEQILKKGIQIHPKILKSYNESHIHKSVAQEFANTSTGEFLKGVHEELRKRNIGTQYLHLLEKDSDFFA